MNKSNVIWALIITAVVASTYFSRESNKKDKIENAATSAKQQAEQKARYLRGAYIANESKLSEFETAKTVIYPGKDQSIEYYDEMYDTTCMVYSNSQTKVSTTKCTGLLVEENDNSDDRPEIESDSRYSRYD